MPAISVPLIVEEYDKHLGYPRSTATQQKYLAGLISKTVPKIKAPPARVEAFEGFQQKLHAVCAEVANGAGEPDSTYTTLLQRVGSYGTGTAITSSDLDLVLTVEEDGGKDVAVELGLPDLLEAALLERGYGCRLQSKTRNPVLRVCERPNRKLYKALCDASGRSDSDVLTKEHTKTGARKQQCPNIPRSNVGLRCHIHFSNPKLQDHAQLLKAFIVHHAHVGDMIMFVKHWAQLRGMCNPSRGTLPSFGYTLMVLNYLTNVVQPPLAPLVLEPAQENKERNIIGNTLQPRYVLRDSAEKVPASHRPTNGSHKLGSLIQGFFLHYGWDNPSCPHRCFDWEKRVLSLNSYHTECKATKGWDHAKLEDVELYDRGYSTATVKRFNLLAIEDPADPNRNVAETVNRAGVEAIRNEFKRARRVVRHVGMIGQEPHELLEKVEGNIPDYRKIRTPSSMNPRRKRRVSAPLEKPEEVPPLVDLDSEPDHPEGTTCMAEMSEWPLPSSQARIPLRNKNSRPKRAADGADPPKASEKKFSMLGVAGTLEAW